MRLTLSSEFETNEKPEHRAIRQKMDSLDLDCIKFKLMDPHEGKGWTREQVDIVELEYRRFLYLTVTQEEAIVPTISIDSFWHGHILDTAKYADDCQNAFGSFIHHFPYFGMRGDEDRENLEDSFAITKRLYEECFGESYGPDNERVRDVEIADCTGGQCGAGSCGTRSYLPADEAELNGLVDATGRPKLAA